MFNPFVPFRIEMIGGLIEMNRPYLVTQSNKQVIDIATDNPKIHLLATDYDRLGPAEVHYNALVDPYRAILDLNHKPHKAKLVEMLGENSKYKVWAAFINSIKETEDRLNYKFSRNIRNYIQQRTNWQIGSGKTIRPKLELNFGELFITLKYKAQEVRFKLSELEKY